jgi:hypothetical protein
MYGPNSAYAQQMRQQLERRDAASGRRSQYGPREVELQAKLAEMASKYGPGVAESNLNAQKQGTNNTNNMLNLLLKAGQETGAFGKLGDLFSSTKPLYMDNYGSGTSYSV